MDVESYLSMTVVNISLINVCIRMRACVPCTRARVHLYRQKIPKFTTGFGLSSLFTPNVNLGLLSFKSDLRFHLRLKLDTLRISNFNKN